MEKLTLMTCFILIMSLGTARASAAEQEGTIYMETGQYASSATSAGFTFFVLQGSGTKSGSPTCATMYSGQRWVINNNWPAAKFQLSVLLAAAVSGKKIHVSGSGDCAVWGDTETALDVRLANE